MTLVPEGWRGDVVHRGHHGDSCEKVHQALLAVLGVLTDVEDRGSAMTSRDGSRPDLCQNLDGTCHTVIVRVGQTVDGVVMQCPVFTLRAALSAKKVDSTAVISSFVDLGARSGAGEVQGALSVHVTRPGWLAEAGTPQSVARDALGRVGNASLARGLARANRSCTVRPVGPRANRNFRFRVALVKLGAQVLVTPSYPGVQAF